MLLDLSTAMQASAVVTLGCLQSAHCALAAVENWELKMTVVVLVRILAGGSRRCCWRNWLGGGWWFTCRTLMWHTLGEVE